MKRLAAFAIAVALAAIPIIVTANSPLCGLFEPWSAEWIALGCWYGAP